MLNKRVFTLIADTHLRDRQWGLESRGLDFYRAFANAIEVAAGVSRTLVHGGDIIDQIRPSAAVAMQVQKLDAKLRELDMVMVTVAGNHDGSDPHWLEVVTDQKANRASDRGIVLLRNERYETGGLSFFGAEAGTREGFVECMKSAPASDVLIWHGTIAEMAPMPQPHHVCENDLPCGSFKFGAFGDLHIRQFRVVGPMMYGFPGSTEMCEVGEDPNKSITKVDLRGPCPVVTHLPIKTQAVYIIEGDTTETFQQALEVQVNRWMQDGRPPATVIGSSPPGLNLPSVLLPRFNSDDIVLKVRPLRTADRKLDLRAADGSKLEELKPLTYFADKFNLHDEELNKLLFRALSDPTSVDISLEIEAWLKKRKLLS